MVEIETGAEWMAKQPNAVQDRVLGKAGGEAYRNGEVSLNDFVKVNESAEWGTSITDGGVGWARLNAGRNTEITKTQWVPSMNETESKYWAANSPLSEFDMFHFTSKESAESIRINGFRDGPGVYGRGIYTTTGDSVTANSVGASESAVKLRVRTNAMNPVFVENDTYNAFNGLYKKLDQLGVNIPEQGFDDLFDEFRKLGHDAVVMNFKNSAEKPHWVIFFEKQSITVIE